jgi:Spy/CpxP family protein refolding chaperone
MKMCVPTTWLPIIVTASVLIVGVSSADARQRHKWWESGDIKAELNITDEQSEAIDEAYQTARPNLRALMDTLNTEGGALSLLVDADDSRETDITEQIDKAEAARGALSKERLLMVLPHVPRALGRATRRPS